SSGFQTPFDVGQQYASWWFENAASADQRDQAHVLSGGGLPPEIDRPLLQFACETLHEYTLSEAQRVNLRDGSHSGIRCVLINITRNNYAPNTSSEGLVHHWRSLLFVSRGIALGLLSPGLLITSCRRQLSLLHRGPARFPHRGHRRMPYYRRSHQQLPVRQRRCCRPSFAMFSPPPKSTAYPAT